MSQEVVQLTTKVSDADKLRKEAMGVSLSFTWMGIRKRVSGPEHAELADSFEASKDLVSLTKTLINTRSPIYRALAKIKSQARSFWLHLTLPYVEHGVRLIRQTDVPDFRKRMEEYQEELEKAAQEFSDHYPQVIEDAKKRLGRLFKQEDYPTAPKDLFSLEVNWPNLNPPSYLKAIDPELYEEACRRVTAKFEKSLELAEGCFASELKKLCDNLAERLTPNKDGTPKKFKNSSLENFLEFFQHFRHLNVRSNSELEKIIQETEKVVSGVDPQDLRLKSSLAQEIKNSIEKISSKLDGHVEKKPRRKVVYQTSVEEAVA